jgi:hypothetical protein
MYSIYFPSFFKTARARFPTAPFRWSNCLARLRAASIPLGSGLHDRLEQIGYPKVEGFPKHADPHLALIFRLSAVVFGATELHRAFLPPRFVLGRYLVFPPDGFGLIPLKIDLNGGFPN